jgi:hypothetical protein
MNSKVLFALLPFFLVACSGGDDDSAKNSSGGSGGSSAGTGGGAGSGGTPSATGGGSGTGGTMAGMSGMSGGGQCVSGTMMVQAVNNYTFSSDIKLTPMTIKANEPNINFDWSGVTTDFLGRATDPMKDIDSVLLGVFSLTVDQFEQHLNADDGMLRTYNQGALQLLTNEMLTQSNLEDFPVPGTTNTYRTSPDSVKPTVDDYLNPDKFDPTKNILVLMPSEGVNPGSGAKMIQVLTLDATSTTTNVSLGANTRAAPGTNGHTGGTTGPSMSVTYDTNIHALTPIKISAGDASIMVDWSALTTNGLGRDWIKRSIVELTVGHYTQSLSDLENNFFDLKTSATALYTEYVPSDDPISLNGLTEQTTSAPFTGIDSTGTWIMALFCDPGECGNPAPWFLTILQTCN